MKLTRSFCVLFVSEEQVSDDDSDEEEEEVNEPEEEEEDPSVMEVGDQFKYNYKKC